ncbi:MULTISPECIES: methionine ABC transporter ATP-binding protein [Ligilactobacillus]|uniref:D-methionine ABC transporter, ATP-binding protein, metN n=1 Tax=Ligilactobacillus animalis TaxID=1605 RepID=A0AAJ6K1R0_9LACO|nr:methionine ABC transporter ATP-binding protein [Ligilactobacillus animalis]KDA45818.1 D-methionine ABC transporter, ATP-binding protein, metN [Ligilactobacillus animalis]KRM59083.1 phosphate ABC transporter ATP-binding protein [Ligilactobacillus animalis KCTC 3501 = DSM 20602]MBU5279640.1 methionine ABC transporter ATP-binding protein [Ligilactobacillus animalis]MDO5883569.1 methionine ABC transporter ATP-binding protein [Ligilactobacillus animalis]MDQ2234692.1 methionine ABC transporter AT
MIEFKQVSKTFATASGQVDAVKNVDLTINAGEVYGIVGFSGAGKSTLVRMLNGLETPTSGEVIINGKRIDNLKGKELRDQRKKIGIIFQHFNLLWSRTVLENIEFPLELIGVAKEERHKKAKHLADLVGLGERINAYPSQLSGGQKQRVGIARALATDPDILISDEATSALDPQTTDEVLDLLDEINEKLNLTIVIITHEMHVIRRLADKVAVMENGQVIEEGPVSEVFTHPKEELTKRFVSAEVDTKQTTDVKQVVANLLEKNPQGKLVELKFHGQQVERPVINELSKNFPELEISILEGSIHQLADKGTIGSLFVQLVGPVEQIKEALTLLEKLEVEAKVIEHG